VLSPFAVNACTPVFSRAPQHPPDSRDLPTRWLICISGRQ